MGDTNTICDCGHFQGWHDPISGHVGKCLWPNGWPDKRECDCDAFTGPAVVDAAPVAVPDELTTLRADTWDEGRLAGITDMSRIIGWGVDGGRGEPPEDSPNPYRNGGDV